jgi:hypothetical protein
MSPPLSITKYRARNAEPDLPRRRLASMPTSVKAGALVFVMAFALYSLTTSQLTGYDLETGAVAEGLVLEGHLADDESSPLPLKAALQGEDGQYYARTGLLQPLLMAPFYAAGRFVDSHFGPVFNDFPNAYSFLWFYNPFVAALAALAIFALVLQTRRSLRWAAAIAALFTVASIAWPYSKIGMETTFMAAILIAFALAVWARRSPSVPSWGLTGFATGAAVATKAYGVIAVIPIAILLWPAFAALDRRQRVRLATAVCLPVLVWGGAIGFYNWSRFGSATEFGYGSPPWTKSAPLNVLGLLFSPGKGLLLYSPLIVLGALGLPRMWREDRSLALALLAFFLSLTFISGASIYWGDEVWGPRYIVPAAWTLLVPIAWWAGTAVRQKVVAGVACVAILVQVVGISTQYPHYTEVVRGLSGVPVYQNRFGVDPEKIPYGDDPTRWIPELSALLIQTEGLLSSQVIERAGGDGLEVTYAPFEGRSRTVDLSDPKYRMGLDFWWVLPISDTTPDRLLAAALLILAAAAGGGLYLLAFGRRWPLSEAKGRCAAA